MTQQEVDSAEHFWHVLTSDELSAVAKALAENREGFSEEQYFSVISELIKHRIGNVLLYLVVTGEIGIYLDGEDRAVYYYKKRVPTSKLDLLPGQKLRYTKFGQEHLKKSATDEPVFVRWIEDRHACILKVKDSRGEISNKKYLRDYLDFTIPVFDPPEEEPVKDWMI